jgi:hypothetical protein
LDLLGAYWPWWLCGLALALVSAGFWDSVGRPLGVSGMAARVLDYGLNSDLRKGAARMADPVASELGLLRATLEEFAEQLPQEQLDELHQQIAALESGSAAATPVDSGPPWHARISFLVMLTIGAFGAAQLSDGFAFRTTMGAEFSGLFGDGPVGWATLLFGGVLVGFGTRMSGGCTSGHGLSGCGSAEAVGTVGTAAFFGTAIGVSLLLSTVLG